MQFVNGALVTPGNPPAMTVTLREALDEEARRIVGRYSAELTPQRHAELVLAIGSLECGRTMQQSAGARIGAGTQTVTLEIGRKAADEFARSLEPGGALAGFGLTRLSAHKV